MKKILAMLALFCSVAAHAQGPDFPITLANVQDAQATMWLHAGTRLTWHSSIPGLSFCVAYSAAHGAVMSARMQGHVYSSDLTHCLVTGRDGNASDSIAVDYDKGQDASPLVIATVILVDNQVNTVLLPMNKVHYSSSW